MSNPRRASNGHRWRILRAIVLAEEPNCAACGIALDPHVTRDHPRAPQVDHIIPFSRRPDLQYDRDNLQAMCRTCNMAKAARVSPPVVRPLETSRKW